MGDPVEVPLTTDTAENDISGREVLVNIYPEKSGGGKYPFTLKASPGLAFFLDLPTYPVLQIHQNRGRCFACTPTKLYEIFANGSFTELGDVNLEGERVSMEDNGIQLVMVDGIRGFYYDTNTNLVQEITDPAFYPARTVNYQDGYFIFDRVGTEQFFISDLLDVTFDPIDFATEEGQPDLLVSIISDHRELFMFGRETIGVWYNAGSADFPFERNPAAFIEKGCAAPYSVAKQDNLVYFVGNDRIIYQMQGYTPVPISTHIVDESLKGADLDDAYAYTYEEDGHLWYVLTIPERELTWAYDITTNAWHIREDYNFQRSRVNCHELFDKQNLVGDFQSGRIFVMDRNTKTEDESPIVRRFRLPTINVGRNYLTLYAFELDMSTGVGNATGPGSDPEAKLRWSIDAGKTWSSWKTSKIGKMGQYLTRCRWLQLGRGRSFVIEVEINEPIEVDIGGAYIET